MTPPVLDVSGEGLRDNAFNSISHSGSSPGAVAAKNSAGLATTRRLSRFSKEVNSVNRISVQSQISDALNGIVIIGYCNFPFFFLIAINLFLSACPHLSRCFIVMFLFELQQDN